MLYKNKKFEKKLIFNVNFNWIEYITFKYKPCM